MTILSAIGRRKTKSTAVNIKQYFSTRLRRLEGKSLHKKTSIGKRKITG
jgi:hypothetical protein